MAISAIGSSATAATANSNLSIQDFMKVLLTQLTYQDPLKPLDNQQFMSQIAQFTTLQQTQQMNTNIEKLLSNQSSLQSVGLIGRTVDISTTGGTATGTVSALSLSGVSPSITVVTTAGNTLNNVGIDQITAVR
jgi:flagellar basal-body rod modification protein FlgD